MRRRDSSQAAQNRPAKKIKSSKSPRSTKFQFHRLPSLFSLRTHLITTKYQQAATIMNPAITNLLVSLGVMQVSFYNLLSVPIPEPRIREFELDKSSPSSSHNPELTESFTSTLLCCVTSRLPEKSTSKTLKSSWLLDVSTCSPKLSV